LATGPIVPEKAPGKTPNAAQLTFEELRAALRQVGEERYHHKHPFHLLMHEGKLSRGQLQAWALNRYYYQSMIPVKDAIILSRATDPSFRRVWRKRIVDHDGDGQRKGGIERWIKLAEATGLDKKRVMGGNEVLPATRFIGNEYLHLVQTRPFLECVASSLTELFSRDLITLRVEKLREHYPWLASGLDYFEARLTEAPEDAAFAIQYVFDHAATRRDQERVIQALRDKCDILWAQLDALYFAYVEPGWPPPGAFRMTVAMKNAAKNAAKHGEGNRG
jgi:pyrroloquinoline-quinone synthase